MKHLLKGERYILNANLVSDFACVQSDDSSWIVGIRGSTPGGVFILQHFLLHEEAQKECDRINKWLEQFIDYEAA